MNRVYTGRRAEQLISGATIIVMILSRSLSSVRAAMIPGIAQAKLLKSGTTEPPLSPTLLINRSMMKAVRAI